MILKIKLYYFFLNLKGKMLNLNIVIKNILLKKHSLNNYKKKKRNNIVKISKIIFNFIILKLLCDILLENKFELNLY